MKFSQEEVSSVLTDSEEYRNSKPFLYWYDGMMLVRCAVPLASLSFPPLVSNHKTRIRRQVG